MSVGFTLGFDTKKKTKTKNFEIELSIGFKSKKIDPRSLHWGSRSKVLKKLKWC